MIKDKITVAVLFAAWDGNGAKIIDRAVWHIKIPNPLSADNTENMQSAAEIVLRDMLIERYGLGPNGEESTVDILQVVRIPDKTPKTKRGKRLS